MIKNLKKILAIALITLIVSVFLSGCIGNNDKPVNEVKTEKPKIVIAIQPTQSADEISSKATELEKFLEERVNADVEIYIPMSYSSVVESLRFGQAQVGLMSAWPSAIATKRADSDVALAEVREVIIDGKKTNETFYYSYYIVMKNSNYTKLEDLKGKRMAYASYTSTSGYLFPVAKLIEKGLIKKPESGKEADPKEFFGEVIAPGGYSAAWQSLKNGQSDVSVIAGDVSEKLFNEIMDNTRVIETQGPIPSHSIVYSKSLKEPLRTELTNAFMELSKPEHQELMKKLVSSNFVGFKKTTSEEHLAGLSASLEITGTKLTEKLG